MSGYISIMDKNRSNVCIKSKVILEYREINLYWEVTVNPLVFFYIFMPVFEFSNIWSHHEIKFKLSYILQSSIGVVAHKHKTALL